MALYSVAAAVWDYHSTITISENMMEQTLYLISQNIISAASWETLHDGEVDASSHLFDLTQDLYSSSIDNIIKT